MRRRKCALNFWSLKQSFRPSSHGSDAEDAVDTVALTVVHRDSNPFMWEIQEVESSFFMSTIALTRCIVEDIFLGSNVCSRDFHASGDNACFPIVPLYSSDTSWISRARACLFFLFQLPCGSSAVGCASNPETTSQTSALSRCICASMRQIA